MLDGIVTALGTLVVVIGILLLTYISTKFIGKGVAIRHGSSYMKIVDKIAVGQNQALLIVTIGKRHFLVGTSSSSMSLLSELNEEDLEEIPNLFGSEQKETFNQILKKIGNRKK